MSASDRTRLSRVQIVDAAARILERGAEVSMRAVAAELGAAPMSLYNHVSNKDDLLDGVIERWLSQTPLPADDLPLHEWVVSYALSFRAHALSHAALYPVFLQRPTVRSTALRPADALFEKLAAAGLPDHVVARLGRQLLDYVMGSCAFAVSALHIDEQQAERRDPLAAQAWREVFAELPTLRRLRHHLMRLPQEDDLLYIAGVRALLSAGPQLLSDEELDRPG